MYEPSVCAILLTANRPQMAAQAVRFFLAQTYANKRLLILDTGTEPCGLLPLHSEEIGVFDCRAAQAESPRTIGELRNMAGRNTGNTDILIHWDDDDYSHPNRIAEQVRLLQSSGADCVGYNKMLFWREHSYLSDPPRPGTLIPGEAWLYTSQNPQHVLGTSLCYWRRTWERRPFDNTSIGEDHRFTAGLKVVATSSVVINDWLSPSPSCEPRMVARIHSGNTSNAYRPDHMAQAKEWKRIPQMDQYLPGLFA